MKISKEGYLNNFVKSTADGGWGLCEWIVSIMTVQRGYTHSEIFTAIQSSGLDASIKALSKEQILEICKFMVGRTFSGVTIGKDMLQTITTDDEGNVRSIAPPIPKSPTRKITPKKITIKKNK